MSVLGLGPIWMTPNEAIRRRAAAALEAGGIFAFGLSERTHGADIYSTDMVLTSDGDGWKANGRKYYIGNGNAAAIVSVFGRFEGSNEYVFFAADPTHPRYRPVQNVCASQNYVSEFALEDYPVTEADMTKKKKVELIMPNYEFQCQNCNKKFSVSLSLKEREEKKYKCPKCGSRKSQPVFGAFYSKTSKKS